MAKQADLLSVEEARGRILDAFGPLPAEEVALEDLDGRVLAGPITAPITVPPFANSSMDGFAVHSSDTVHAGANMPVSLRVTATSAAGSAPRGDVGPGECVRIMTGAPLPSGLDAVVPFEDVLDEGTTIRLDTPVSTGACVRPAGQDVTAGQLVLRAGELLRAPQIGLLASLGIHGADVTRRPVVSILSTGDELVQPGRPLQPGQIYNSNTPMLASAVQEAGGRAVVFPLVRDDEAALAGALVTAQNGDLVLTSGGASVGDFDYVKNVLSASGEVGFWRVRMRPGKPLIFGRTGDTPLIGLPGNPTSAMVTFEQFARPAIRVMLGLPPLRPRVTALLDAPLDNHGGRRTYARVTLAWREDGFRALPSGPQDSAMLAPLAHADGLVELFEERERYEAGDRVQVQVWRLPVST